MLSRKKALMGTAAVMVALSPLAAQQAEAATQSVNIDARINAQISFTVVNNMNFGILTEASLGSASLNFADTVTNKAGGLNPAGGTPTSAKLTVNAEPSQKVKVSSNTATVTINNTATADTMKVDAFTFQMGGKSGATISPTMPVGGNDTLLVGADLNSFGGQKTGLYQGTFKVDVVYP